MVTDKRLKELSIKDNTFIGGWYIPSEVCDEIIDYFDFNDKYHKKGTVGKISSEVKIDPEMKDSIDLSIGSQNFDICFESYRGYLQQVLFNYLDKYQWANEVSEFNIYERINIQKYPISGGFKKWHFENGGNSKTILRHLVFMTYLNDVEEGGTEFFYQNVTTPAKKGLTLIWPAGWTHPHRGQVSNKKEKYIVTGWYSFKGENND